MYIDIKQFSSKMSLIMPDIIREFVKRQSKILIHGKITIPQLLILDLLERRGDMIMSSLASLVGVSLPAMTGIIDRLARDGDVLRLSDPNDRRIIVIRLTKKGEDIIHDIDRQRKKMIIDIFGQIEGKERQEYLNILSKIHAILFKENTKDENEK